MFKFTILVNLHWFHGRHVTSSIQRVSFQPRGSFVASTASINKNHFSWWLIL